MDERLLFTTPSFLRVLGGSVVNYLLPAGLDVAVHYGRDGIGRIVTKTETINGTVTAWSYGYDTAGRLTDTLLNGSVYAHYDYDPNGNRVTATGSSPVIARLAPPAEANSLSATYDAQDRMLSYGSNTYAYTANGELTAKTDISTGKVTTYQYDVLGNLKHVNLPDGTAIDYIVDGQNRRIGRKVNGTLTQAWLYDGQLRPVAELDSSGNVVSRFVYATHINVPDYMVKGAVTYRIITDHLGSPRFIIDSASGTIAQRMDYDDFGNILLDTAPGFQPFGFAGGMYDYQTRLVRFGARDYDAETGRWTRKDPVGFWGSDSNIYSYSFADPANLVDRSGTWAGLDDAAFMIGGAALGVLGQAIGDAISGQTSGWEDYLAAGLGGAVGGEALLYCGPVVAGMAGAFATDFLRQSLRIADNKQCSYSPTSLAVSAGLGALGGGFMGEALPGVNAGRGSWNSIFNQMTTKFENGTISSVSGSTALKMFAGRAYATGQIPGTIFQGWANSEFRPLLPY